ncbi:MAG: DUF4412 domain-containing protein [Flavobacteriaceae bacterium]
MKTKRVLFTLLLLGLLTVPSSHAQLLKKIKKKAENAVERTILNKTDEKVSKKTGDVIDDTTDGKKKEKGETQDNETENESSNTKPTKEEKEAQETKMGNFFGGGLEEIRDTYSFSYSLVYQLTTKKESMSLVYLLEPDADYFGNKMVEKQTEQLMVYDFKKNAMVTFMDNGQQKMAMKMKMPNLQKSEKKFGKKIIPEEEDVEIVPIKGKTILGYPCDGYQVTSKDGVGKFWVTNDAPVTIMEVYANFKSLPKSARNYPITEKSLILEMNYVANKGTKDNMEMVCTQLTEKEVKIHKKDYQSGF